MSTKKKYFEKLNMTDNGSKPSLFEYDAKNDIVDVFVYRDPRCPYPYTITNTRKDEDIWTHQGFFMDDFIRKLDVFFKKNDIPYHIVKE